MFYALRFTHEVRGVLLYRADGRGRHRAGPTDRAPELQHALVGEHLSTRAAQRYQQPLCCRPRLADAATTSRRAPAGPAWFAGWPAAHAVRCWAASAAQPLPDRRLRRALAECGRSPRHHDRCRAGISWAWYRRTAAERPDRPGPGAQHRPAHA